MSRWFSEAIVDTGRLPLFFMLVAFLLAFLFIRFSVRMIRAEVSWWPGNVTPGGMHIHHVMFGLVMMLLSGFGLVILASEETPVPNCILASVFGVGSALVLDEFALVLHLRDVYWAEEGRSSIDAVFVAIAILTLFLLGLHPIGLSGDFDDFRKDPNTLNLIVVLVGLAIELLLVVITLLKGKVWTGLLGIFIVPLLIVGSIRLSRPNAPWARWRYTNKPRKFAKAVAREQRLREPVIRAKIVLQEAVSGRFGVPADLPQLLAEPEIAALPARETAPNALLTALRWRLTRQRLRPTPSWRLPMVLVVTSIIAAFVFVTIDADAATGAGDIVGGGTDHGSTATLLSVIAGGMVTLTGLVFTALTLAMQTGAAQISVKIVPILQHDPLLRWSIGMFLSTFVFSLIIALDLALDSETSEPVVSTVIAFALAFVSVFLLIALVAKVASVLNPGRLLRWTATQGRDAILRSYPGEASERATDLPAVEPIAAALGEPTTIRLRRPAADGRVLLAVNVARIQRLAIRWGVNAAVEPSIGEFVALESPLFTIYGPTERVREHQLLDCLLFGEMNSPMISPVAALQTIVDIALKALSPAVTDPGRAVQAIDHIEDLLLLLAERVRRESAHSQLSRIRGYQQSWADYVAVATDEVRHYSTHSTQVQRRLRSMFTTLIAACPPDQHKPLLDRIAALDARIEREWPDALDAMLARVPDPQGLGSESGRSTRTHPLVVGPATPAPDPH
ncbi:DUF2254 domain-containing protein [Antrihabitans sp. YC3-6]|uniref:DUF2254 domain-containing protein n=1 Tax=Antrihabitans stalagmiti TaxID=2799499 RepID=A0A934NLR9_9NOCA|nr:DUF2254 family protein [Antrihabitans stalagmiti]MBJ8337566.1 DUF2254 domain-containing protein [Antrihabitans stalagmiti]